MNPLQVPACFRDHVLLSEHTSIGLGGPARWFAVCTIEDEVRTALEFARAHGLRVQVLGGGTNSIFRDEGFEGVVLSTGLRGLQEQVEHRRVLVSAAAGEPWDTVVQHCIIRGLQGVECLSGIPGLVGATPIQNVGAYGQEVSETIVSLRAIDTVTLEAVSFPAQECAFGYRFSRFKTRDAGRYIITRVTFALQPDAPPAARYPELKDFLEGNAVATRTGPEALAAVRAAVLTLRKKKSMLIDPSDPNSRSVGSFFINPVLSRAAMREMERHWRESGGKGAIASFPAGDGVKIPAAWLVEHAGFSRGTRHGGAAISDNHALALVNRGTTTRELLEFATMIEEAVFKRFGIRLQREPVVVS